MATSRRALTPEEIRDLAKAAVPSLNLSTVYRQLKRLLDDGSIVRVDLPGQAPRYEATTQPYRPGADHRHHFHCDSCDSVYPISGCPGPMKNLAPRGFRVERHEITLHGRCARCAQPQAGA